MPYITVVPALRTVPGVEEFDYAVERDCRLGPGDLVTVPFRKKRLPGLVIKTSASSLVAEKAVDLGCPQPLLKFHPETVELLERISALTFSAKPSILFSWIRHVPKRAKAMKMPDTAEQLKLTRETRTFHPSLDPLAAAIKTARDGTGRTLVLCAWKTEVEKAALKLGCPALHSDLAPGAAWKLVADFASAKNKTLVVTKLGAWLAACSDRVVINEPENDDFKQDELAPRYDARRLVQECARLNPKLAVSEHYLTPRLGQEAPAPEISLEITTENTSRHGHAETDILTDGTLSRLRAAAESGREIVLIHPVHGFRARQVCKDCGWRAVCPSCGYGLSPENGGGLCRHCGKKSPLPRACPSCNGTDFSKSRSGRERLAEQIKAADLGRVQIRSLTQALENDFPQNSCVAVSDLTLLAGAIEDIRRRERLVMNWRKIAARAQTSSSSLLVQGREENLTACRSWLTTRGLAQEWEKELAERKLFGYPPAGRVVKLIVRGSESQAEDLARKIKPDLPPGCVIEGPFSVAFRPHESPRHILHFKAPLEFAEDELIRILNPWRRDAIIDLDPVAFFS
ncbi:MAG: hypothetical protein WC641_04310 [Patescibacteria group bacterium]